MQTREITKEELGKAEVICYGYKAIAYDGGTLQEFGYGENGENLKGKIFTCDGDIKECEWGLHFSKDPAYVFNFYEPLGYNRYFKIAAYSNIVDDKDGFKSVAQTIEFVEEYDIMKYIELIKKFDRSVSAVSESNAACNSNAVNRSNAVSDSKAVSYSNTVKRSNAVSESNAACNSNAVNRSNAVSESNAVNCSMAACNSNAVCWSNAVSDSKAVCWSNAVCNSNAACNSNAVNRSNAVSESNAVGNSTAVSCSYGLRNCEAIKYGIFCYKKEGAKYVAFNKKIKKERFEEIFRKITSFNYKPNFDNFYELKGNKEWWALCFPELCEVDNKTAWSKMPKEMLNYIKSLPEYDEEIFKKITED